MFLPSKCKEITKRERDGEIYQLVCSLYIILTAMVWSLSMVNTAHGMAQKEKTRRIQRETKRDKRHILAPVPQQFSDSYLTNL